MKNLQTCTPKYHVVTAVITYIKNINRKNKNGFKRKIIILSVDARVFVLAEYLNIQLYLNQTHPTVSLSYWRRGPKGSSYVL